MSGFDDDILRAVLSPARTLEPTEGELAHALHRGRQDPRRRTLTIALIACVLVCAGAYAVPVTRAAIDDVFDAIAGDASPGRPVRPSDDAPSWVRESGASARVVAEQGGVKLSAVPSASGELGLGFVR